uniref:Uncharacterized protein n=1 Tax=Romanomermis culicivorax TaxID=13658 RepID=A0A915L1T3_ROMCU
MYGSLFLALTFFFVDCYCSASWDNMQQKGQPKAYRRFDAGNLAKFYRQFFNSGKHGILSFMPTEYVRYTELLNKYHKLMDKNRNLFSKSGTAGFQRSTERFVAAWNFIATEFPFVDVASTCGRRWHQQGVSGATAAQLAAAVLLTSRFTRRSWTRRRRTQFATAPEMCRFLKIK